MFPNNMAKHAKLHATSSLVHYPQLDILVDNNRLLL